MDAADREDKEVDRSNPGVLRRQGVGEVSTMREDTLGVAVIPEGNFEKERDWI